MRLPDKEGLLRLDSVNRVRVPSYKSQEFIPLPLDCFLNHDQDSHEDLSNLISLNSPIKPLI